MKAENRKQLRNALVGKQISDVVFHGGHGLVIEMILNDGTRMRVCTYDDGKTHDVDDFYVSINEQEL